MSLRRTILEIFGSEQRMSIASHLQAENEHVPVFTSKLGNHNRLLV